MSKLIPVLVTTDKRGVFFAHINPADIAKDVIPAKDVQMCIYWSPEVRGVLGLAATGPDKASRVSRPVSSAILRGVTLVCEVSPAAEAAWKKLPWST